MKSSNSTMAFPRRDFLKGGGALVIGFSLGAVTPASRAFAQAPALPDPKLVDSWIAIHRDNTATAFFGKVELGQGSTTALLQIVAEELDVELSQLSAAQVDTKHSPNQGATVSSSSVERAGPQVRAAAAEARQELLRRAAQKLGTPVESLTVMQGIVHSKEGSVSYGELLGDQPFNVNFTGTAPQKPASKYRLIGSRVPRVDISAKVAGTYDYMQHATLPGMLHGRVVRPRGQGAYGAGAEVLGLDETSMKHIPDARIVRKGDFIGVVAPRQWDAVRAAEALKVTWRTPTTLSGDAALHEKMRSSKTTDSVIVEEGDVGKALSQSAHVVSASYRGPYQAHAPFGPSCALAEAAGDSALVICSTQDVYALRERIASVLGLPETRVRVQYVEGAGCFGHSCYDDAALAAAIMSQLVGKPVRVQFMRWDELGWDNYGPAHLGEIRAAADSEGKLVALEYHGWHHGWMIDETSEQLAVGKPVKEFATGAGSLIVNKVNVGGMYVTPNRRLINHAVSGLEGYLKGANLRSPLDLSYSFASEQTMDGLAYLAELDPVEFRRRNIRDPRWLGVLDAVVEAAKWTPRRAASARGQGAVITGRGVALGTHRVSFGAAVAEIEVNRKTGLIVAKHIYAALDCGLVVNPGAVESQIIGMTTQATSRVLKEEVRFSATNVTSLDWGSYPVLRFAEHPNITPILVQPPNTPSSGAGEEALAAAGAAIANAFFDATGVRLKQYPMTPDRVRAALA
ncbi:MAG: isoquinoline 1-oxidoreductase subunit beta IorB, molybdoprotein [Rhodospirillales bacterium]|jgi:nicotinate dehydrogenase subunit B|nr:isoquinoline 1-oxidoreductase subunit beta IorB, molybdoprotein [Rhodospirillales bacterium]